MQDGRWITRPCDWGRVEALARCARGERDHGHGSRPPRAPRRRGREGVPRGRAAGARPLRARRHGRRRRANPGGGRGRGADLRPRRLRRRRHLRHRRRRARPARAGGERRVAPAEPVRGGLRLLPPRRSSASRRTVSASSSPSTVASPRSTRCARAKELGLDVIVTDHHRPGRDAPGLPDRRDTPVANIRCGALRHGRRLQARSRRCSGTTTRRSHGTSIWSRSLRSPTSSHSWTRTARSLPQGSGRSRGRADPGCRR